MAQPQPQTKLKRAASEENEAPGPASDCEATSVLHVVVVGFHHKKGCQVDFSYPPLIEGQPLDCHDVPTEWKHLPFLAVPDGAHNYEDDTIYFHLPGRGSCKSTVYGVSCYRQIKTEDLLSRDADVTRGTVQKSVCVLSTLPLYGLIQAKLELITHAYFCERDFSKTEILHEFYASLSSSIPRTLPPDSQVFMGLPLRDLVLTFKHKILVLFKLLLLERRILFFTSPVHKLCSSLLAIISLFPGMIERGLKESACPKNYNPHISTIELKDYGIDTEEYLNLNMSNVPNYSRKQASKVGEDVMQKEESSTEIGEDRSESHVRSSEENSPEEKGGESVNDDSWGTLKSEGSRGKGNIPGEGGGIKRANATRNACKTSAERKKSSKEDQLEDELMDMIDQELFGDYFEGQQQDCDKDLQKPNSNCSSTSKHSSDKRHETDGSLGRRDTNDNHEGKSRLHQHSASIQSGDSGIAFAASHRSSTVSSESSQTYRDAVTAMRMDRCSVGEDFVVLPNVPPVEPMDTDDFGFPLAIFGKGSLCHPYMSLQQHDLLQDVNVRSFMVGATNVLFKHHRHLMDVIVEVDEGKVNILDAELRKQLTLSTADLRFADFLIKTVSENSNDNFLDRTGWEGGDEWIRAQFKLYVLSLLSTCTSIGTFTLHEIGDFNEGFVQAWKTTHNFRMWSSRTHSGIDRIHTGHPFHGQISVNDMKIRLTSVMQTTERGKKINSAINKTGVAVMHTGKVVGDALTSAKSAVSSWLYGLASEWKEEGGDETNKETNTK